MKNSKIELNSGLSELLGNDLFDTPMDATKSFFAYAKANNLLDGSNRKIILDAKLKKIFRRSTLPFLGLTQEIIKHSKINKILNPAGNITDIEPKHHILTIGFIPENNDSDYIYTGDPEASNTKQITIKIFRDQAILTASNIELNFPSIFPIQIKRFNLSQENSRFWEILANYAETILTGNKNYLYPKLLAKCFLLPQNAAKESENVIYVAGTGSEFEGKKYNRFYYAGYEFYDGKDQNDMQLFIDETVYIMDF